jgi:acyl-CoA thioesterase
LALFVSSILLGIFIYYSGDKKRIMVRGYKSKERCDGGMNSIDIEQIRKYFDQDRFALNAGARIDSVTEESVVCSMDITPEISNAAGAVQGGAIFTLADLTFAVHSNLDMLLGAEVGVTVGQSCAISFLRASKGHRLIANSTCLNKGRRMSVYRIVITDDLGQAIAEMTGNGYTTAKPAK